MNSRQGQPNIECNVYCLRRSYNKLRWEAQERDGAISIANMSESSWEPQPETFVCYCWALWPSTEPKWSWECDGIVQFALPQPYWDCEDCACESMESSSLISQGLYPSSNTYFIIGKGKQKACEALLTLLDLKPYFILPVCRWEE